MKDNFHKKMTFDDGDSKHWIKNDFKGWAMSKKLDRKIVRRKMNKQCEKEYSVSSDLPEQDSVKNTPQIP